LLGDSQTRVSLRLTHGLGNAICVAAGTQYEFRWPLESRLRLIRKLINACPLDLVLVPVRCPPDCSEGNVVDHVYYRFAEDKSIFDKAFYALTAAERVVSIGRAAVLELLAEAMREASYQLEALARMYPPVTEEHSCLSLSIAFIRTAAKYAF
uniref:Inositol monophosphatase n=1 Tax=Schistocephalus solidus TaxID=70667 RepID=A0A183TNB0_SCHSO